jgi:hypothetical protein
LGGDGFEGVLPPVGWEADGAGFFAGGAEILAAPIVALTAEGEGGGVAEPIVVLTTEGEGAGVAEPIVVLTAEGEGAGVAVDFAALAKRDFFTASAVKLIASEEGCAVEFEVACPVHRAGAVDVEERAGAKTRSGSTATVSVRADSSCCGIGDGVLTVLSICDSPMESAAGFKPNMRKEVAHFRHLAFFPITFSEASNFDAHPGHDISTGIIALARQNDRCGKRDTSAYSARRGVATQNGL